VELRQTAIGFDECVLYGVFRLMVVAKLGQRDRKCPVLKRRINSSKAPEFPRRAASIHCSRVFIVRDRVPCRCGKVPVGIKNRGSKPAPVFPRCMMRWRYF
jgi:hypothetical protein